MGLSLTRADHPARIVEQTVRLSLGAVVGIWVARRLTRGLALLFRSPFALIGLALVAACAFFVVEVGPWPLIEVAVIVIGVCIVFRVKWPEVFGQVVGFPMRSRLRGAAIYRLRWTKAMETAGLAVTSNATSYAPTLGKVRSTLNVDRVRVRMLPGQTIDDYAKVADRLAQTFAAEACRVHSVQKRLHDVELWLLIDDPLQQLVTPAPARVEWLEEGLPIARGEDGLMWRLRLIGSHVLVVGATGAGKGSVIWSVLRGLQPAISAGLVRIWAIDPKGGMELSLGRRLFARFCHGDSTSDGGYEAGFALMLEDAVTVMRSRQDRLRGVTRLHEPSTSEPLIVLVIDELAALTGWVMDRTVKKRIESSLGLLLSQGRAVGVVVIGAVQDPRKDVLPMRDLFPTRIALRLNEAEQVGLVLGPGARNRGAQADLIPDSLPGVGYVAVDGIAEPVRVRFAFVSDDDIDDACTAHEGRPRLSPVDGTAA